jgi:patatin-like phospholipase/acyl hydrolase
MNNNSSTDNEKKKPYRIISFDGGGIRGAFTTQVLLRLTKPPYNIDLNKVQLYAGTSTGSVIATGLAMGLPIETVAEFYSESNCKFIFSRKRFFGMNLTGPKYKRGPLREFLTEQYKGCDTFDQLKYGLSLSSFKLQSEYSKTWLSVFFNNRQNNAVYQRKPAFDYTHLGVLDAVLASSAAPTYFPAYKMADRPGSYIDGGVIANNPGMAALSVATKKTNTELAELQDIRLLSIGNGRVERQIKGTPKWGILGWMGPSLPLLDILSDGSSDADNYYCMSMLGRKGFRRIQVKLDKEVVLDDYASVPEMVDLALAEDTKRGESTRPHFGRDDLESIAKWFNAD